MEKVTELPILLLPKSCTTLEMNCDSSDNVFINMNITAMDTEDNTTCIYSGLCNIKLIDAYEVNIKSIDSSDQSDLSDEIPDSTDEDVNSDDIADESMYDQSQVWIDPTRSPYVYNHCGNNYDNVPKQECYSICRESHTSIQIDQSNTYITKNTYEKAIHYSCHDGSGNARPKKQAMERNVPEVNFNENDEFECGVILSHLPEDIINEKQNKAKEELKYIGIQSENGAVRQLMSTDMQSLSKQRKTILFLGHDAQCGQTIQQIAYYDPTQECTGFGVDNEVVIAYCGRQSTLSKQRKTILFLGHDAQCGQTIQQIAYYDPTQECTGFGVDNEVVIEDTDTDPPKQKRYQCAKCNQIFNQITEFREHMGNHSPKSNPRQSPEIKFTCNQCGKNLKNREKFENHCMAHGDPDLECSKCHKVFASKFSLRAHKKIHNRKFPCTYCTKSFSKVEQLKGHTEKAHFFFKCDDCPFQARKLEDLTFHQEMHEINIQDVSSTEFESIFNDLLTDEDFTHSDFTYTSDPDWKIEDELDESHGKLDESDMKLAESQRKFDEIQEADSIIAKVMSNKMFLAAKNKKYRSYKKVCDVCYKSFARLSDLKRHLIEHVVRSTLAKSPVNIDGTLTIQCEVCQAESFSKIDQYKAHLREHAKLTIYKCTFCDKSFSDSSNFSKHKKIHGAKYFQCDLCQRKFNSKKMLTLHFEYHNQNQPIQCTYCEKEFHFESMLNKHIKSVHNRKSSSRFRCRFCQAYFRSLKLKWDHEWHIHNVRKMIVDCLTCGAKFRKYAELRKHCNDNHDFDIPSAKKLLKKKSIYRSEDE